MKNVLVALDSSDLSEQIIRALDLLHLQPDTNILLVHVILTQFGGLDVLSERPDVETEEPASLYVNQLKVHQTQIPYSTTVEVVQGNPAEEIVRLAHIYKSDLIVIGSRGLTGLDRVLRGSVSSQVVEEAPCSVLIIKQT